MKASLFALFPALLSFVQASPLLQRNEVSSTTLNLRTAETCGDISDLVPLFQVYDAAKTVHFYTIDNSAVTSALDSDPYVFNGVAALIFPTAEISTVPFYCVINKVTTTYFFTTSDTERTNALTTGGFADRGIAGYIYPTQICGSIPLYRAQFPGANADWLYTTSAADRDNAVENQGFTDKGIAGYVLEIGSGVIIS